MVGAVKNLERSSVIGVWRAWEWEYDLRPRGSSHGPSWGMIRSMGFILSPVGGH